MIFLMIIWKVSYKIALELFSKESKINLPKIPDTEQPRSLPDLTPIPLSWTVNVNPVY